MKSLRNGIDGALAILAVSLGNGVPVELERPVEAADVRKVRLRVMILESVVVDDVDDGTHDGGGISLDPVEQRFHPA